MFYRQRLSSDCSRMTEQVSPCYQVSSPARLPACPCSLLLLGPCVKGTTPRRKEPRAVTASLVFSYSLLKSLLLICSCIQTFQHLLNAKHVNCVFVCLCVRTYTCLHIHTHICAHTCIRHDVEHNFSFAKGLKFRKGSALWVAESP